MTRCAAAHTATLSHNDLNHVSLSRQNANFSSFCLAVWKKLTTFAAENEHYVSIKYITESERDLQWGLSVCSAGFQSVLPGESYPPRRHGVTYLFNPSRGRVLQEYQLLYIVTGRGTRQPAHGGTHAIEAGTMFLLFPGEWHSYHPDAATGWDEYWIGFKGPNIDNRVAGGFLAPQHPVFRVGVMQTAVALYRDAIAAASREEAYFQLLLCGIVNHLLGLMFVTSVNLDYDRDSNVPELIRRSREYMQNNIETPISMPDVAMAMGVSYSSFRRLFKHYTGVAPSHYFTNLRLHRAKQLLLTTTDSIKEICFRLQFENPEYFATLFKRHTGQRPSDFRRLSAQTDTTDNQHPTPHASTTA